MYTLKSIARRGTPLAAVFAIVAATLMPAAAVFADALNPLTERSLLLSSSAPGFQDTDGSGNSEGNLNANGEEWAPPGSGPNGKKSGETFSFNVSTDSSSTNAIKAFTLQYCTTAAGKCQAPGNNSGDARASYPASGDPGDPANSDTGTWSPRTPDRGADSATTSDLNVNYTGAVAGTDFQVFVDLNKDGDFADANENASTGWTMATSNVEDLTFANTGDLGRLTGANNYITLTNATGIAPPSGAKVQIVFKASSTDYITNPGTGAFFVKMNTYKSDSSVTAGNILDGGVTVANVMTDSIHITTKVLETMAFSVGTQNPDTQAVPHGSCDAMQVVNNNRLNLGNPNAEYSLETSKAWDVHSYLRLSSNSSGGATVYYSGDTLRNTVGDYIAPIGAAPANSNDGGKDYSHPGTEQFGLALVDPSADALDPEGTDNDGTNDFPANHIAPLTTSPLIIEPDYADGNTASISDVTTTNNAQFAFKKSSLTIPAVIAQENTQVLSCATAKIRYVGNIAADTPAGVYTTKINYLAAPQY
jgi:hypothetical protein